MCDWLGVSTSGFYAWEKRKVSRRKESDRQLLTLIKRIYTSSNGRYGSPRVHKALERQGIFVSRKRVARLMREAN